MGNNHITNAIRRLRFEHGEMTQQALAERIGVTRRTLELSVQHAGHECKAQRPQVYTA
jgi:DNA-binding transcriptional regulator LsrR (DeoR family)